MLFCSTEAAIAADAYICECDAGHAEGGGGGGGGGGRGSPIGLMDPEIGILAHGLAPGRGAGTQLAAAEAAAATGVERHGPTLGDAVDELQSAAAATGADNDCELW